MVKHSLLLQKEYVKWNDDWVWWTRAVNGRRLGARDPRVKTCPQNDGWVSFEAVMSGHYLFTNGPFHLSRKNIIRGIFMFYVQLAHDLGVSGTEMTGGEAKTQEWTSTFNIVQPSLEALMFKGVCTLTVDQWVRRI